MQKDEDKLFLIASQQLSTCLLKWQPTLAGFISRSQAAANKA